MEGSGLLDAEELALFALRALENSDLEKALITVKTALLRSEFPLICHAIAGKAYARMELWEKASQCLSEYTKACPEKHHERNQLGLVLFRSGQEDAAIEVWTEVLNDSPTYPPALFFLAHAYTARQSWTTAQRFIDILLGAAGSDNLFSIKAQQLRMWINEANSGTTSQPLSWPADLKDELLFG